jgi:hypothetical protein
MRLREWTEKGGSPTEAPILASRDGQGWSGRAPGARRPPRGRRWDRPHAWGVGTHSAESTFGAHAGRDRDPQYAHPTPEHIVGSAFPDPNARPAVLRAFPIVPSPRRLRRIPQPNPKPCRPIRRQRPFEGRQILSFGADQVWDPPEPTGVPACDPADPTSPKDCGIRMGVFECGYHSAPGVDECEDMKEALYDRLSGSWKRMELNGLLHEEGGRQE